MKISISVILSMLLTTIFTIFAVCIYCENIAFTKLQVQLDEIAIMLQDADFHSSAITKVQQEYPNISITKQNEYIYQMNASFSYDIPILFFLDERESHIVLYRGGW